MTLLIAPTVLMALLFVTKRRRWRRAFSVTGHKIARASTLATLVWYQLPPAGERIPRALSDLATPRWARTRGTRISRITASSLTAR